MKNNYILNLKLLILVLLILCIICLVVVLNKETFESNNNMHYY